ncbi:MAG: hypothetical protein JW940_12100 [Polyangiaceae bacterium]|nr:hypothetical protein [Polyangiaceae bacterium]
MSHLGAAARKAVITGPSRVVECGGKTVELRAMTTAGGKIDVGTYYVPR